jgi:glycosyltransferase involved in cell wall biosynthesis
MSVIRDAVNRLPLHVVVPNDIDDPATPSGGNVYDRQICRGLAADGWSVREHALPGAWPRPGASERAHLAQTLAAVPDGALVLIDGLVASPAPEVLVPHAGRLRLVVLVHMPLGDETAALRDREGATLGTAAGVVTTSRWCRDRLLDLYPLAPERIHVAQPGVQASPIASGSSRGSELLCVAAVTPGKGHDVLVEALAGVADLTWSCVCVGSLVRDQRFVDRIRRRTDALGLADRIAFVGPRTGPDLDAHYAAADLLVLASRGETFGMVVTEALARGVPVLTTDGKGLPEAIGAAPDGSRPGLLTPPDDPAAFGAALRRWLTEPALRRRLGRSAQSRRETLAGWDVTTDRVAAALSGTAANVAAA